MFSTSLNTKMNVVRGITWFLHYGKETITESELRIVEQRYLVAKKKE